MNFKNAHLLFLCLLSFLGWSQNEVANNLIVDGNDAHGQAEYIDAEAHYRKAVSLAPETSDALHNLGNTNYRIEDYSSASQRYFQTQKNTDSREKKHAAFHNLGNVYMQQKDYGQAVEAFKNGLRNNPTDEETRYNYALAKELLEKEQQQDQQDQQDQNENDQDKQDQDKEGNQDQDKEDENGDQEKPKDEGEDQDKKEGEDGDPEEDSKEDPKDEKPKNPEKEGDSEKKKQPPKQPKPGQISPEQVKSLLEAMNNQEKGVQEKVNAQKVKGVPVKTKKDW